MSLFLASAYSEPNDFRFTRRRSHQFANRIEDNLELTVVFLFQLTHLACKLGVGNQHPTQLNEGTHDLNGCLNSPLAVKDVGRRDYAVFCEDQGKLPAPAVL